MVGKLSNHNQLKLITALLIVLWIYAVGSKLTDVSDFRRGLYNQPFSKEIIRLLLFLLPSSEILASILLIIPKSRFTGLYFSAILLTAFSLYISFFLLNLWPYIPCSCGGILDSLSWKSHLVFNLCFLSITIYAIYLKRKEESGAV